MDGKWTIFNGQQQFSYMGKLEKVEKYIKIEKQKLKIHLGDILANRAEQITDFSNNNKKYTSFFKQ